MNCLNEPGSNFYRNQSCATDFFSIGIGSTTVRDLDLKAKKFILFLSYQGRLIKSWQAWS
jgi:hypothetical protein